jgi:hypothetical protein
LNYRVQEQFPRIREIAGDRLAGDALAGDVLAGDALAGDALAGELVEVPITKGRGEGSTRPAEISPAVRIELRK